MTLTHGGNIFEIARQRSCDWRDLIDFSASINPLGPSPGVRAALTDAMDEIVHYPDRHASVLTRHLAEEWNVDPESILLGNGATDLIHSLAALWAHEQTTLLVPTFSEFHRAYPHASMASLDHPETWPERGLLVMTEPNNPTGESHAASRTQPMLIDESFIDFSDLPTSMTLPNTVVLRSLTKFYAIPGLRIGAVVAAPDLVRDWKERRPPWQVNVLAERAAIESLRDKEHGTASRRFVSLERARMWDALQQLTGVHAIPTHANFYFARLDYSADKLYDWMLERNIILRNCTGWPGIQGEAVRFAIRTATENDRLIAAWKEYECAL
jgi:threonine-phosphate decarboxylase